MLRLCPHVLELSINSVFCILYSVNCNLIFIHPETEKYFKQKQDTGYRFSGKILVLCIGSNWGLKFGRVGENSAQKRIRITYPGEFGLGSH